MRLNKTVLVTGATGFLGGHIVEALVSEGFGVVVLKRSSSSCWRIKHLVEEIKIYNVDITPLENIFSENKIYGIIHTACNYGRDNFSLDDIINVNINFGIKILTLAEKNNVQVFINSDSMLSRTTSAYALSKRHFAEWLRTMSGSIKVINLRIEHMFGLKDDATKFVPWVISQLVQRNTSIALTSGLQKRDFIFVTDVVSVFLLLLHTHLDSTDFEEYQVGTGSSVTLKSFLSLTRDIYEEIFGDVDTEFAFGAIPDRPGEAVSIQVDISKLSALGWSPVVGHREGLQRIVAEWKSNEVRERDL
jgi:CDP-paratose synthetase